MSSTKAYGSTVRSEGKGQSSQEAERDRSELGRELHDRKSVRRRKARKK